MDATLAQLDNFDLSDYSVLIIDDEPANLSVMLDYLENFGLDVLVARDGESGYQKACYAQPDLILLDLLMPRVNGFETCRRLKAEVTTRDIPVIFMTALTEIEHKVKGFATGAVDYIGKPFQVEEVLARVKTHLVLRTMQKQLETQNIQLQQEIVERERAEEELKKHRDHLEELVVQRTAELAQTNINLQAEIMERRRIEAALRESEARYRSLFEDSSLSMWEEDFSQIKDYFDTLRAAGVGDFRDYFEAHPEAVIECVSFVKVLDVNQATLTLVGAKDKKELLGGLLGGFTENSLQAFAEQLVVLAEGGQYFESEAVYQKLTGEEQVVNLHLSVAPDHESTLGKVLVSMMDVTERKQAEKALAKQHRLLRTLIDNMPDAVYVKDVEGRFLVANETVAHLMGQTPAELIGRRDPDFYPADLSEQFYADEQAVINTGQPLLNKEELVIDQAGNQHWFSTSKVPLRDNQGQITGIIGIGRNITRRKQIEEEIQRRNRELDLLNRVIAAPLAEKKVEGILEITCRELALAFEVPQVTAALLNQEKTEAVVIAEHLAPGRSSVLKQVIPIEDNPLFQYLLHHKAPLAVDNAQTDPHLATVNDLMKQHGTVSLMIIPLMIEEDIIGILSLGTTEPHTFSNEDMELAQSVADQVSGVMARHRLDQEQQRLEKQYYQAQKMEALGRLTGGVAHDFNNLLTVINGYAELLLQRHLEPNEPQRKDIEQIQLAGKRAADLTRQLLAFSRQQVLQPEILDLNRIIIDIERMLRRLIGEDIDLVTILDPYLESIKADAGQMEQVVMNLVVNARDAMPEGGKLTIETAGIYLDETYAHQHAGVTPGPYVMVAVSDTGTGMDAQTQARIFEPFFTTKEQGKGTGLGLATIHGIVNQSDGHIWVYSEVGQGTTFKVYFPQAQAKTKTVESPPTPATAGPGTETILVVEDDDMVRTLTCYTLRQAGYHVLEANQGEPARQICRDYQERIHLLLTDVVMPGSLNGPQLAKEAITCRPEIKVLYMSGYTDNAIVHRETLGGQIAFLPKPLSPFDLLRKVREVLEVE